MFGCPTIEIIGLWLNSWNLQVLGDQWKEGYSGLTSIWKREFGRLVYLI